MKERKLSIREIIVLLIAVILLISATACRASKADQTKENKKVKEIKIGTMDLVNPDLVARKEKYYEKQLGVKVKIVKFDSGKMSIQHWQQEVSTYQNLEAIQQH